MYNPLKLHKNLNLIFKAARKYDTSVASQFLKIKMYHDRFLFSVEEAIYWGLTDPRIPRKETDIFLSTEARVRLLGKVNRQASLDQVNDKAKFYKLCVEKDLPCAESYGVVGPSAPTEASDDWRDWQVDWSSVPDGPLIAKPIHGVNGKGIIVLAKSGSALDVDGTLYDPPGLAQYLHGVVADDCFLIQRRLNPHPELSGLTKSPGLQTVRIVTFIDQDGVVHLLFGRLKILRENNFIDNLIGPDTGNLAADIDLDDGSLRTVVLKTPGEIGLEPKDTHPDSGKRVTGFKLPDWPQIIELARRGAVEFQDMRCLAWDIGVTDDGPVIIEANTDWEPFPFAPYRRPLPEEAWSTLIQH